MLGGYSSVCWRSSNVIASFSAPASEMPDQAKLAFKFHVNDNNYRLMKGDAYEAVADNANIAFKPSVAR